LSISGAKNLKISWEFKKYFVEFAIFDFQQQIINLPAWKKHILYQFSSQFT